MLWNWALGVVVCHCGRATGQHLKWVNGGFNVCSTTQVLHVCNTSYIFKACNFSDIVSEAHYSIQFSFALNSLNLWHRVKSVHNFENSQCVQVKFQMCFCYSFG